MDVVPPPLYGASSHSSTRHCMVPPPTLLHVTSGPQHTIIIIDISKKTDTLPLSKSVTKTQSIPEGYGTVFERRQNAVPANVPIIKRPETLHMPTAEHLQDYITMTPTRTWGRGTHGPPAEDRQTRGEQKGP